MYWAASCGGCEIAVLNIHEKILDVDANFDVVFWPVAMDAKYKDVEAMEDGSIMLTLFNGGIRNDENEHIAQPAAPQVARSWSPLARAPTKAASPAWPTSRGGKADLRHGLYHTLRPTIPTTSARSR